MKVKRSKKDIILNFILFISIVALVGIVGTTAYREYKNGLAEIEFEKLASSASTVEEVESVSKLVYTDENDTRYYVGKKYVYIVAKKPTNVSSAKFLVHFYKDENNKNDILNCDFNFKEQKVKCKDEDYKIAISEKNESISEYGYVEFGQYTHDKETDVYNNLWSSGILQISKKAVK